MDNLSVEHSNMLSYCTDDYDDYTICHYDAETGLLTSADGGLLARFGIVPPERLTDYGSAPDGWPIKKEYSDVVRSFFSALCGNRADSQGSLSELEIQLACGGSECWVNITSVSLPGSGGIVSLTFLSTDKQKKRLLRLLGQAEIDPLTGALNRTALMRSVEQMTAGGEPCAFMMMDVDGFKVFNDTYGHVIGDSVLVEIVRRLRSGLRREDVIGRIGGDEFMICLRNVASDDSIERLAKHICQLTRQSMPDNLSLSASLGIAVSPRDGRTFEEMYRKADLALYSAKRGGGNTYNIYHPDPEPMHEADAEAFASDGQPAVFDYTALITCSTSEMSFSYPPIVEELFDIENGSRPMWQLFAEEGIASIETAELLHSTISGLCASSSENARFGLYFLRASDGIWRWYRMGFIREPDANRLLITLTDVNEETVSTRRLRQMTEYDELTGLLTRSAFDRFVEVAIQKDGKGIATGDYAFVYFDILRFKAINDMFGTDEGDRLLIYIADIISGATGNGGAACRMAGDRFVLFLHKKREALEQFISLFLDALTRYNLAFEIVCNLGIFVTNSDKLPVSAMLDRAILAQSVIKGSFATKFSYYNESLRNAMLSEQEIVGAMTTALATGQFLVYFQPQYNHGSGELVGAEALVRWQHPERGLLSPGAFIPIFEKNGFITRLDMYMFEQACAFQHRCLDAGITTVPVSVNMTRYDIYQHDFIEQLELVRARYGVPSEYLRLEITESAIIDNGKHVSDIIEGLHSLGYVIEMDDFGSGYSSLNVLKDIDMDILKLDMRFLTDDMDNDRGGTILSSIIRMAKWLDLPVIAEGVENIRQADYLRTIGCSYIQGYLYARPMPAGQFESLLRRSQYTNASPQMELIETMDAGRFWDPESQETLIFNNYVGAAAIFDYHDGSVEYLRVNRKYLREIGGGLTEKDLMKSDVMRLFDEKERLCYGDMLSRAIASGEDEECECWRSYMHNGEPLCIRSTVRVIGRSRDSILFYESIRNITAEKTAVAEIEHREQIFRAASEQANIYYWEYDIATREMLPCFRCQRDLDLPPLVYNYPEPLIENGIFPPETADMYRALINRINEGATGISVDMPLTPERVMFHVRYTTVYDENGKPVKAYGSATRI